MKYVDIHTHSHYLKKDVIIVQNIFPSQADQLNNKELFSVGLHPWHVSRSTMDHDIRWVKMHTGANNVIAVGEIGLDKSIGCPWEDQVEAFERQLSIAESAGKPVILHCVRAYSEMLAYRKHTGMSIPWIFHWFNANTGIAQELIRKNCYLSFGHILFKEASKACAAFATVPLEHVFFETDDAGYSIYDVYEQAARIRNMSSDDLKRYIADNFNKCFKNK